MTNFNLKQNLKQNPSTVHLTFYTKVGGLLDLNVFKYRIFVAKVVVNPNLQGWRTQCKDLEQFHWPGLSN